MNEINLDYNEILKLIPHRLPFLLIDRVGREMREHAALVLFTIAVAGILLGREANQALSVHIDSQWIVACYLYVYSEIKFMSEKK